MSHGVILPVQATAEDIFISKTCEDVHVKNEDLDQVRTQEVITKDETTEINLESEQIAEVQVLS